MTGLRRFSAGSCYTRSAPNTRTPASARPDHALEISPMIKRFLALALVVASLAACGSEKKVQLTTGQIKALRGDKESAARLQGVDDQGLQRLTGEVCSSHYEAGGSFADVLEKADIKNPSPFLLRATRTIQEKACPDQLKRIEEQARENRPVTTTTAAKTANKKKK
jgi:hypothetical protein